MIKTFLDKFTVKHTHHQEDDDNGMQDNDNVQLAEGTPKYTNRLVSLVLG